MSEVKKPTSYDEQVLLLKKRGCIIADEQYCKEKLATISYYRLSAYFLPFKHNDDTYDSGITFERVYHIYEFDRKLRNLLFSAIEVIEISLRTRMSYLHALKYGALGYKDPANFNQKHNHTKFKENYEREIANNDKVSFVKHHIQNYNGEFPVWALSELFTFGMLSYFYGDLCTQDRKEIAKLYRVNYRDMESWLRCCTDLRNICAHYGRLYYRIFSAVPSGLNATLEQKRRLWGAVLVVRELFPSAHKWNTEFVPSINELYDEYKEDIDLHHIAFPSDWKDQLIK